MNPSIPSAERYRGLRPAKHKKRHLGRPVAKLIPNNLYQTYIQRIYSFSYEFAILVVELRSTYQTPPPHPIK